MNIYAYICRDVLFTVCLYSHIWVTLLFHVLRPYLNI